MFAYSDVCLFGYNNWGNDSDSDGGSDYYKKTGVKEDARGTGADI